MGRGAMPGICRDMEAVATATTWAVAGISAVTLGHCAPAYHMRVNSGRAVQRAR